MHAEELYENSLPKEIIIEDRIDIEYFFYNEIDKTRSGIYKINWHYDQFKRNIITDKIKDFT